LAAICGDSLRSPCPLLDVNLFKPFTTSANPPEKKYRDWESNREQISPLFSRPCGFFGHFAHNFIFNSLTMC
jgi:hypothetical protein